MRIALLFLLGNILTSTPWHTKTNGLRNEILASKLGNVKPLHEQHLSHCLLAEYAGNVPLQCKRVEYAEERVASRTVPFSHKKIEHQA